MPFSARYGVRTGAAGCVGRALKTDFYDKRSLLYLSGLPLHLFHGAVGRRSGRVLSFRQGPPRGARTVAHSGPHLLRRASPVAAAGDRPGVRGPEEELRHRAEPQYGDRHSDALLHSAQFPLGLQARGLQDPLLRAVPRPARRHLHQPRPRFRSAGADGPRRQTMDFARRFGGRIP